MLNSLYEINWDDLNHAYGSAADLPGLIRQLTSRNAEVREHALDRLGNSICHQGTVYQATSHVVPFLIELLHPLDPEDQQGIISLLFAIAVGTPNVSKDDPWQKKRLTEQRIDFEAAAQVAQEHLDQALKAVGKGIHVYEGFLRHPSPDTRMIATWLLLSLPEHTEEVLPSVLAHIDAEDDPRIKARIIEYLGYKPENLILQKATCIPALERILALDKKDKVQVAAAITLMKLAGEETLPQTIVVLERAIAYPYHSHPDSGTPKRNNEIDADVIVQSVCEAVAYLKAEIRIPVLKRMLQTAATPVHAHHIAIMLLDTVFVGKPRKLHYPHPPMFLDETICYNYVHPIAVDGIKERIYPSAPQSIARETLSVEQVQAIKEVLTSAQVWKIRSNLLEIYGIFESPEILRTKLF